jgi:hypothetical protein
MTDPLRQRAQVLHRIVVRDFDRCSHTEGIIEVTEDGYREVEPFASRPMSWEELGRVPFATIQNWTEAAQKERKSGR